MRSAKDEYIKWLEKHYTLEELRSEFEDSGAKGRKRRSEDVPADESRKPAQEAD